MGYFVHPAWLLLTAFAGLNLLQSAFTNWCPMVWILARLGLQPCVAGPLGHNTADRSLSHRASLSCSLVTERAAEP